MGSKVAEAEDEINAADVMLPVGVEKDGQSEQSGGDIYTERGEHHLHMDVMTAEIKKDSLEENFAFGDLLDNRPQLSCVMPGTMGTTQSDTVSEKKKKKKKKQKKASAKQDGGYVLPSTMKRKRGAGHGEEIGMKARKTMTTAEDTAMYKSQAPWQKNGMDIDDIKTWDDYCNLPTLPGGGMRTCRRKPQFVVSLETKMVYSGPLSEHQSKLLSFKADVLCNIVKDIHSPAFRILDNVLMYPLCNPELLAQGDNGEVYELFQPAQLSNQTMGVLGTQPVSILEHCLIRYILDIGDTGLPYLLLHGKTQAYVNTHLKKSWGTPVANYQDKIVQFFQSRVVKESRMLVFKCMVLKHKSSLLKFLGDLDIPAIKQVAQHHAIAKDVVEKMETRVQLIKSALSNFHENNIL